ncbi:hypothetical protein B0T17DRAFT_353179 [Bombardia bombarda]|uniref:Uncharacterized protein n=1 Tax=Bombardia bombarda TaxID=252184 RepID=A0AA40BW02_9PEZI|nr:hypothetical protein B0T17DRAFT_353179 [Bombardia bombarda]
MSAHRPGTDPGASNTYSPDEVIHTISTPLDTPPGPKRTVVDRLSNPTATGIYSPTNWPFPKETRSASSPEELFEAEIAQHRAAVARTSNLGSKTSPAKAYHHHNRARMSTCKLPVRRDTVVRHDDAATAPTTGPVSRPARDLTPDSPLIRVFSPPDDGKHDSDAANGTRSNSTASNGGSNGRGRAKSVTDSSPIPPSLSDIPERSVSPTPYSPTGLKESDHKQDEGDSTITTLGHTSILASVPENHSIGRRVSTTTTHSRGRLSSATLQGKEPRMSRSLARWSKETQQKLNEGADAAAAVAEQFRSSASPSLEGIIIFDPAESTLPPGSANSPEAAQGPTIQTAQNKNSSIRSRLSRRLSRLSANTAHPNIDSIRRGPKIRHNRIASKAILCVDPFTGVGMRGEAGVSGTTICVGGGAGGSDGHSNHPSTFCSTFSRVRTIVLVSVCLLQLSIVAFVAGITTSITSSTARGSVDIGTIVWTTMGGVLTVLFAVIFTFAILRYRNMYKQQLGGDSNETWIEMHHRSRALPPRPSPTADDSAGGDTKTSGGDVGATEAWAKFAKDHERLRRYVECLEHRIGALKEEQSILHPRNGDGREEAEEDDDATVRQYRRDTVDTSCPVRNKNQKRDSGIAAAKTSSSKSGGGSNGGDSADSSPSSVTATPQPKTTPKSSPASYLAKRNGSVSQRNLLKHSATNSVSSLTSSSINLDDDNNGDDNNILPLSGTKTSILTDLCDAVMEPYSPLSSSNQRSSVITTMTTTPQSVGVRRVVSDSSISDQEQTAAATAATPSKDNSSGSSNTGFHHLILSVPGKVIINKKRNMRAFDIFNRRVAERKQEDDVV